jgi:DNA polymerase-1
MSESLCLSVQASCLNEVVESEGCPDSPNKIQLIADIGGKRCETGRKRRRKAPTDGSGEVGNRSDNRDKVASQLFSSDRRDLDRIGQICSDSGQIAVDCETYHPTEKDKALRPYADGTGLRVLSVAAKVGGKTQCWAFDLRATGFDLGELGRVLNEKRLVCANACFDLLFLRRFCGVRADKVFDVLVAEKLMGNGASGSEQKGFFSLAPTLKRRMGVDLDKTEQTSDWGSPTLTDEQFRYAVDDVRHLLDLAPIQIEEMERDKLAGVFNLEMRLIPVLVEMRAEGIKIDLESLAKRTTELEVACGQSWDSVLREFKARGFQNPFRFGQKAILLKALHSLGCHPNTEGKPSTNKDALAVESKKPNAPAVLGLIREFRRFDSELKQARQIAELTDPDGRLRTNYRQMGAWTGRLSSAEPNLQNIQKEGSLRGIFTSDSEDRVLVVGDFVGMEMVAAGCIAGEKRLLEDIASGRDIHTRTASRLFEKAEEEVTKAERALGKLANFNLLYGGGARVLFTKAAHHPELNPTLEELEKLRLRWLKAFPAFALWHDQHKGISVFRPATIQTLCGRRKLSVDSYTQALNFPVQGSCADCIKRAMVSLHGSLLGKPARLLLTTHDELAVECPKTEAEQVAGLMKKAMEKAFHSVFGASAPVSVEIGWGRTWKEAKGGVK